MPASSASSSGAVAAVKATASAAVKKNTVDYIPSKLSYDTAIPIAIYEDRSEFIERCKPYDIIDGPNPLDDLSDESAKMGPSSSSVATAAPTGAAKTEPSSSSHSRRKRSRSPTGGAIKIEQIKVEAGTEGVASPSPAFTRPSRAGWAAEQLKEGRPYQLLRSRDMELRVRYILDDSDYDWCSAQGVAPEAVQRGITYLEWAYVSYLLTAARPHLDEPLPDTTTTTSAAPAAPAGADSHEKGAKAEGQANSSGSDAWADYVDGGEEEEEGTTTVFSPTAGTIARFSRSRRQRDRDRNNNGSGAAATFTCALCSKNVQLLTMGDGVARAHDARGAQKQGDTTTTTKAKATESLPLATAAVTGTFPSHDLQHQGLRCRECGVVAHLRCWFLTEPPRVPSAWTCDGCTNYAQHRKRSAGVCCMCGRMGGVLLPYVGSPPKDDGDGTTNGGKAGGRGAEPQSPLMVQAPHAHGGSSASLVAQSDMVCHAVCALAMAELAIQPKATALRRSGLVNMEERPYVYALRRVGKQRYAMHCVFCEHGGTGRCVQCHHPHCFEAMHASCAAEAHTVDCHTEVAGSPSGVAERQRRGVAETGAASFSAAEVALDGWASCSTYCRKHYGYSVSNSVGSAALNDKAEAEALALDLTGLLTGTDGVTSPVVRKRGRGRPPVALVQQREAERDLIQRLHVYWLERREQRRRVSGQLVGEINARLRHVVEAALRPEVVKVSADKVRLSHFLSLVPEWQWQLVSVVEGELPLPDEEYDDVQKYRKVAHTRRSGNTRGLYDRMTAACSQLDLMCRITTTLKQECRVRRISADLEMQSLRALCSWK